MLDKYIKAGELHKNVETDVKNFLKPDMNIIDIANFIEDKIREYSSIYGTQINDCIAFPTGISINNVAAHYTPNYKCDTKLKSSDVCKIDFGTHIDGFIIDSAFTINIDNKYASLLEASRESVDKVIKNIGIDARFNELSLIALEIVESYEVEINNKLHSIKPLDNLAGHNILPWQIHGSKRFYSVPQKDDNQIVEEGDVLAIEIFASTGSGTTILDRNVKNYSHYSLVDTKKRIPLFKNKKTNILASKLKPYFASLPFCNRYIDFKDNKKIDYLENLQELFRDGFLNSYPPILEEDNNALVAQFEDTIFVGNTCTNLSRIN